MSDKKTLVREEYLSGIKAHNRSLVSDKNNLINKLTEAEDKILQLNSKIETLQEENIKLKEELKSQKKEEIQMNFTPEEEFEPISEPQYEPKIEVQKKSNIANNIQTEPFNPYKMVYLTPLENLIIEELLKEPQTYNQLSGMTGVKPENLRTHKKNLGLKGIKIENRKIPGTNNKMLYINEEQFKRTKIQIKAT